MSTEFSNDQFDAIYPPDIEKHYWASARTRIITETLRKNKCVDARILEIGCGRGVVLNALRKEGFDCFGVELATPDVASTVTEYVQYGKDFSTLDEKFSASVHVVLLLDVIEHIEDDVAFLIQVQKKFPNLKHILITVPARAELWSNSDVFNGHFRRYTHYSLTYTLSEAQLAIEYISYFCHLLCIPIVALALLGVKRNTAVHSPKGFLQHIHKIISIICVWEYRVFPRKSAGSSLIAWCSPKRI